DGKSLNDFPKNTSLLVVRSGQDQFPGLNETIDRFVDHALAKNLSIALINHPDGTHAFDLEKGSKRSREIIQQILNFLQLELLG
ncbi:MAG TPA: alpha/beta hydrolase, partial [Acidobacteriota bacterium]|nr:alpha/beta hydrolase [Acidobacteriota bacterium]